MGDEQLVRKTVNLRPDEVAALEYLIGPEGGLGGDQTRAIGKSLRVLAALQPYQENGVLPLEVKDPKTGYVHKIIIV